MLKKMVSLISLLLFIGIGLFSVYSFIFPFEAGQRLQGAWFGLILFVSPIGIVMSWFCRPVGKASKIRTVSIIGHLLLLLFLILYMTLGYVIWGV
jgi:hypothetical protein